MASGTASTWWSTSGRASPHRPIACLPPEGSCPTLPGRPWTSAWSKRPAQATPLGSAALLEQYPDKLHLRTEPYEQSLLHVAASGGHLEAVDLLLRRGLDVNTREKGDNTYPMHWAAAAGHLQVVRRLADAGGDVVGDGDDHALDVIGWASCWGGCDDDAHRAVVDLLVSRGARHHIFSAIAMNLADEVRGIVSRDPAALNSRMSRNENHQLPLHFAVRMNRPEMVALLMDLGADPLAVDGSGFSAAAYAASPLVDRRVMEGVAAMTSAELTSAVRGDRRPRAGANGPDGRAGVGRPGDRHAPCARSPS